MQGVYKRKNSSLRSLCLPVVAAISGSLESILGLLKHFQIWAQAILASRIGSLESIPGLLKRLQIRAQATLASGLVPWNRFLGSLNVSDTGSGYIG